MLDSASLKQVKDRLLVYSIPDAVILGIIGNAVSLVNAAESSEIAPCTIKGIWLSDSVRSVGETAEDLVCYRHLLGIHRVLEAEELPVWLQKWNQFANQADIIRDVMEHRTCADDVKFASDTFPLQIANAGRKVRFKVPTKFAQFG